MINFVGCFCFNFHETAYDAIAMPTYDCNSRNNNNKSTQNVVGVLFIEFESIIGIEYVIYWAKSPPRCDRGAQIEVEEDERITISNRHRKTA